MAKLNKIQIRQKELSRDYMKLYNKLDMYGQAPNVPLSHPWQRDIVRLQNRWETVKSYARVFRNYERAVREFNATYYQQFDLPTPHTRIDTRTLETLRAQYKGFQKYKRNFKKRIVDEWTQIINGLLEVVQYIEDSISEGVGRKGATNYQANCFQKCFRAKEFLEKHRKRTTQNLEDMQRIKNDWEIIQRLFETYIYVYHDPEKEREAWGIILYYITGNGEYAEDILIDDMDDLIYE